MVDHFLDLLLVDDQLAVWQPLGANNLAIANRAKLVLGTVDQLALQCLNLGADVTSSAGSRAGTRSLRKGERAHSDRARLLTMMMMMVVRVAAGSRGGGGRGRPGVNDHRPGARAGCGWRRRGRNLHRSWWRRARDDSGSRRHHSWGSRRGCEDRSRRRSWGSRDRGRRGRRRDGRRGRRECSQLLSALLHNVARRGPGSSHFHLA